jgi:hypothetical protein
MAALQSYMLDPVQRTGQPLVDNNISIGFSVIIYESMSISIIIITILFLVPQYVIRTYN